MKGTMLIIAPNGVITRTELTSAEILESLQKAVGGYLEVVPHFHSIDYDGAIRKCVVMCNEEGKIERPAILPHNPLASDYWAQAMRRDHGVRSPFPDYLVGNIVVLFGDREFMEAL